MLLGRLSRDGSRNSQHMFYGSRLYVRVGRDGVVWLVEPRRIQGCARVGSFFLVFSEAHRLPLEWLFESRFDGQGDLAGCRGRIEANARDFSSCCGDLGQGAEREAAGVGVIGFVVR